jgi:hypothetical protein
MPAFTFEKISPARRSKAAPEADKKRPGLVVQLLDRFTGARVKRSLDKTPSPPVRKKKASSP